MVMVTFVFEFDRADKRYKAGDTVFCKLHVTVHERFKARSLSLRFAGKAYTQWSKTGLGRYTVYKGKEEYFREYQFFFGSLNGPAEDVKPGKYQYESSFVLPKSLPSSIAHPYGCIRYTASARYEVAWDFNFKGAEEFYVKTIVDLADQPELKNCVKEVSKKGYSYFSGCCDAGFVYLKTILPRGGWLLNQPISIDVIVDNKSKLNVKLIKVKLRERITFHSKEPKPSIKETTKTIAKYSFDTVIPQFQDKLFQIQFDYNPLQEWKLLQGCSIITCEYFIESQAFVNSCRLPTVNVTKITFGTISSDENGSATTLTAKSIKDVDLTEEHPVPAILRETPILIREPPKSRELSPIPSIGSNINWSSDLGEIPDVDVEMAHLSFLDDPPTALFPDQPNS
ncbi:arrestin domain-containing protein 17-like [Culicoides brevitarsis]|uniref:arrestin domain-containing protein 17-like n=1 Tax=Culicoides brevitarsis TaxID=469753 RepID=UPI00307B6EF9